MSNFMRAYFRNPEGYTLKKVRDQKRLFGLLASKAIYEYTADLKNPLTFVRNDGSNIQPERHLSETDMGSVPPVLQPIIPKDRYLLSYLIHDSAYKHHWLWKKGGDNFYYKTRMTRKQADKLLYEMVLAEGTSQQIKTIAGAVIMVARVRADAALIYAGVRVGGFFSWRKCKKK